MDNYGGGAVAMRTLIRIVLNLTLKLPKHFPVWNSPKNIFLLPPKKSWKHFPVGGGDKSTSYFTGGGKLFKALVSLHTLYDKKPHNCQMTLISRYVQLSFTAVHPPYQAPKKFLRLHTQVVIECVFLFMLERLDDIEENLELLKGISILCFHSRICKRYIKSLGGMKIRLRSAQECKHLQR